MLQNAYFLAKIGADTAENERNFAENLPKIGNYPTGRLLLRGVVPVVGEVVGECRLRAARAEGDRLRDRCERRETR